MLQCVEKSKKPARDAVMPGRTPEKRRVLDGKEGFLNGSVTMLMPWFC